MPWDLLIRGGRVVTPDGVKELDIAVEGGSIAELSPSLSGAAKETIDATGLHVFPGVIDPHVHFNEPGRAEWEGFATGSAALAAGGGTCFFDMPLNASPPTLDGPSFDLKLAAAQRSSLADFGLWGGLTPINLDKMNELAARGVVGFKAFMCNSGIDDFQSVDDTTLARGARIAAPLGLIVALHAESQRMTAALTAELRAAGKHGWADYLASRPIDAEFEAIVEQYLVTQGCRVHIVHVSSAAGVEQVRWQATKGGADVTCETCPHYLALTEADLFRLGAPAKCAPPLRPASESERLWAQLQRGDIAFVASDHSPAPPSMKTGDDAFSIWGGIAGVQSTLPILLSHDPPLPLDQVARLTSTNIAERFGIPRKGRIAVGFDADFALVDVAARSTLRRDDLLDRHKLSPYVGRDFRGVVRRTIMRGGTIFADGRTVGPPRGKLVKPNRS